MREIGYSIAARNKHVPQKESNTHMVKERVSVCYHSVSNYYKQMPKALFIRMVVNTDLWLNVLLYHNELSTILSLRDIMTGQHFDIKKHRKLLFGAYAQAHEEYSINIQACTIGAICLGPLGNNQGVTIFCY